MKRISIQHIAVTICCLSALPGCQSNTGSVAATADCEPLPAWLESLPIWPGSTFHTTQLAKFQDKHSGAVHVLRYDITISREALVMSAQTTLGLPLYDSVFSKGCLEVNRHVGQLEGLPASPIVGDFVLATWPVLELSSALSKAGYTLRLDLNRRTLVGSDGEPLVTAVLPQSEGDDTLQILHHDIPLEITIQILDRTVD